MFAVGFHGPDLNDDIRSLIRDYGVGAIVLFKRNVRSASQLQSLCHGLQQVAKDAGHAQPLFVGIDQENGLVTRISPPVASQQPGPMTLGAAGSLELASKVANATAEMLQYFGINMNYAPVGDINSEPLNPVIGVRSPGDDPKLVGEYASACAKGMRANRVVPCIKHFPGHGDTAVDSHYGLPVIDKSRSDMDELELLPFRRAVEEGIEMIMTAHISLPQLSEHPATLSKEILSILRDEYKFDGIIMTDCMEMDGVRAKYGKVDGSLKALQAGVDNVMICHTYDVQTAAIDRVCEAIEKGELSQEQIEQSLRRLSELKSRFTNWDRALQTQTQEKLEDINQRGQDLAQRVYSDAVTLVRSEPSSIPASRTAKTIFVSPGPNTPIGGGAVTGDGTVPTRVPWVTSDFVDRIRSVNPTVEEIRFTEEALTPEQWAQIDEAEVVVLATRNAREAPYQRALGLEIAKKRGSKLSITVATCAPYDFLDDNDIKNYIAVYEPTVEAFGAAIDLIYGTDVARGKLPVKN